MGPNYDKIRDQTITPMPTQIQMPEQTTENGEGVNEMVPGSAGIMQAVVLYSRGGDHYADSESHPLFLTRTYPSSGCVAVK